MDIKQAFAQRLIFALDSAKVEPVNATRKKYLATLLGITERHAGNYLRGEKLPTPEGMIQLAQKMGLNPNWLWAGNGPMKALTQEQTDHLESVMSLPQLEQTRVFSVSEALVSSYTTSKTNAS